MNKQRYTRTGACVLTLALATFALTSCANAPEESTASEALSATDTAAARVAGTSTSSESAISSVEDMPNATVVFGQGGQPFTFVPEKNESALTVMRNITEIGRNLPIYTYEGFEGDEVMQYYEVPSRYSIPAASEQVVSQQAGEVYLSDPNRIMVFYQDAQIAGNFTYLGRFENVEGLAETVINNPVVNGYTNKIISVSYSE